MFFILSKLLLFLLDPLVWLLALSACAIYRLRGPLKKLWWGIWAFITLLSCPAMGNALLSSLETLVPPTPLQKHYPVVIVFSGMLKPETNQGGKGLLPFGDAVERILLGSKLVKSGRADYLLITGRSGSLRAVQRSEAEQLARFAKQTLGVDPARILVETQSRNTAENAEKSAEILHQRGWSRGLVVTSAFHAFRVQGCFQKLGLELDYMSTDIRTPKTLRLNHFIPSYPGLGQSALALHEAIGIVVYGLTNKANYKRL